MGKWASHNNWKERTSAGVEASLHEPFLSSSSCLKRKASLMVLGDKTAQQQQQQLNNKVVAPPRATPPSTQVVMLLTPCCQLQEKKSRTRHQLALDNKNDKMTQQVVGRTKASLT